MQKILDGGRIPNVLLACLKGNEIRTVSTHRLFAQGRTIVMGVPGAFTPVCTRQHVPDFVSNADKLAAAGYNRLICLAPNDPYVLTAWADQLDPENKIDFYSDGNLAFATALRLQEKNSDLFLGWRSKRYMMSIVNGVIQKLRVETSIVNYSCTRAIDALDDIVLV